LICERNAASLTSLNSAVQLLCYRIVIGTTITIITDIMSHTTITITLTITCHYYSLLSLLVLPDGLLALPPIVPVGLG